MTAVISISVGCAIGIPCGLALIISLIFWYRSQKRFKKELENDVDSMDDVFTFSNIASKGRQDTEETIPEDQAVESKFSDDKMDHDTNSNTAVVSQESKNTRYIPAYRKKLNSSINTLQNSMHMDDTRSINNSSLASLDTVRTNLNHMSRTSMLDQIIPVLSQENIILSESSVSNLKTMHSSDSLIKSLNIHDFGSYPKRKSNTNLNSLSPPNDSSSLFYITASSTGSHLKSNTYENVFDTPPTQKSSNSEETKHESKSEIYMLKNNYNVDKDDEIAEEDQYENEFTNYSENKREFINSLRPKTQQSLV